MCISKYKCVSLLPSPFIIILTIDKQLKITVTCVFAWPKLDGSKEISTPPTCSQKSLSPKKCLHLFPKIICLQAGSFRWCTKINCNGPTYTSVSFMKRKFLWKINSMKKVQYKSFNWITHNRWSPFEKKVMLWQAQVPGKFHSCFY